MARFLIATMPSTGHFTPGVPLARELLKRGHEVWWYTGKKFREKVESIGARFVPMKAGFDYDEIDLDAAFPGRSSFDGLAQFKFDMKRLFIDAVPGHLADLEEVLAIYHVDILINDTGCMAVPMLAERWQIPYATFGITALTASSVDAAPFGLGVLPRRSWIGRVRNRALQWLVDKAVFRDVMSHYQATRKKLGLSVVASGFLDSSIGPYLYLQATVPSFEYPRSDLPAQIHFIGPFRAEPSSTFKPPPWWDELDNHRPVVHVTQGTAATDSKDLIVPTLQGLARENMLVVAATGGKAATTVPLDPLPANARVEPFIPYYHFLPKVKAMVTNGGYGGVQMALAHGIPLVVAGTTEDKPEIANRVEWSGAGINLRTKHPKPEQIRNAVRTVLGDPKYRQRAQALKSEILSHEPAAKAADLLEQLARSGRPVLRSA